MKEMVSRRWMCVFVVAMLVFSILLGSRPAHALSPYDDFNDPSNLIRKDLWSETEESSGIGGEGILESFSTVDRLVFPTIPNPKLNMIRRLVVGSGATSGFDHLRFNARNASTETGIQADVTMVLCISPDATVEAGIQHAGFNDGTSSGPGDRTGDLFARLRFRCTDTNLGTIAGIVLRCGDATCDTVTTLGTVPLGAANIGQEYTLHVMRSGNDFVFTGNGQTQTFTPGATAFPVQRFANLTFRMDANTPANGAELIGWATWDNVMLDP